MKLSIDFNKKEITLLGDWVLGDLHSKLKEICGTEEANWDSWFIKQEVKTVILPTKTDPFNSPLSQPYKPYGNQPTIMYSDNITSTIDKISC